MTENRNDKSVRDGQSAANEIILKLGWEQLSNYELTKMLLVMVVDQRAQISALCERLNYTM